MTPLERLRKRLPKKYQDRLKDFTEEEGLVDDCRYLLVYTDEYTDGDCAGSCYPVRSIDEAIRFIRDSLYPVSEWKRPH